MVALGVHRALELFKEIEEKKEQMRNPSGYLKTAAKREVSFNVAPVTAYSAPQQVMSYKVAGGNGAQGSDEEQSKIHRRITWLNGNVFQDQKINDEAIGAMYSMGVARAFELLKEIEEKKEGMRNPSGYLIAAAKREGLVPPGLSAAPAHASQEDYGKVHKRATWLNANVFKDRQIDQDAIAAMSSLGVSRAFELFKEIEAKADQMKNPSGYLKKAAQNEGFGQQALIVHEAPVSRGKGQGKGSPDFDKLHRRVTWLNGNVFTQTPIDPEAIEALAELGADRGFEMLKELEAKGADVKNPGGYLKASVKRALGLLGPSGTKRTASSDNGPPAKKR